MDTCEVLIVGGGPAGSTTAWRLRRAGLDVLLLDARIFPRDKSCAGWITPAVLKTLGIKRDEYCRGRVLQDIGGFRTGLMQGAGAVTRYDGTVSHAVRRHEFDHFLLQRSETRCVLGESVVALERKDGGWLVNGKYRARLVVGAGGHWCPVARLLGARIGAERIISAQSAEFALNDAQARRCGIRGDTPELLFSRDLKGYGWIIRKERFLNVGFGRMDRADFGRHLAEFRSVLEERGGVATDTALKFRGHAYRTWQRREGRNRIGDGVLLVGDSAGLANPVSGEGILPAIESALLASETILAAGGDYRRDNLEPYPARLVHRFARSSRELPFPIPHWLMGHLATLLISTPLLVRHLVLNRWFLHSRQKLLVGE